MPLRVTQAEPGVYFVAGTPTDCVHLAVSGFFDTEHDIVVSGINDGANLGDDVLYSGTVAAAIEGRFLGLPAIAISLCTYEDGRSHYDTAAQVGAQLVRRLLQSPLDRALILNVNVPDRPYASAFAIVPSRSCRRTTRVAVPCTGWALPGASRMPGRARTSMRWPKAMSRSRRCRSI